MRTTDALSDLRKLGLPIIETGEASARLGITADRASQILKTLHDAGLVQRLRQGLWAIDLPVSVDVVPSYLTAPYPAYISFWSALARHGMIEQIPRQIFVASLDRTKTSKTTVATFSIHRLAPEVFGGSTGSPLSGYLATPEKALFDAVYLRAPRGRTGLHLPELELPPGFDEQELERWLDAIPRARMRTLVARGLEKAVAGGVQLGDRPVSDPRSSGSRSSNPRVQAPEALGGTVTTRASAHEPGRGRGRLGSCSAARSSGSDR